MTKDQLRPAVISWAKARTDPNEIVQRLTGNRTPKKLVQKLVKTDELQHYMDNGWFFRSVVNTEYVLVEREESTQPPNESATEQDSRQAGSQQQ